MPAPNAGVVFGSILSLFPEGTSPGENVKLAQAVADVLADACARFVERVKMAPGVPCAVAPPSMMGTVAGVGTLFGEGALEPEVRLKAGSVARGLNMIPDDQKKFVESVTRLVVLGFDRYTAAVQIMPGTPVAGGITATPMSLTAQGAVVKGELDGAARALNPPRPPQATAPKGTPWTTARPQMGARPAGAPMMGGHRRGAPPPPPQQLKLMLPVDFPQIVARAVEATLDQVSTLVLVAPGIPVVGQVTGTPGDLI